MKALVLLSGGLDSATVLAMLRGQVKAAVGFDYGQPHRIELEYAHDLADREGIDFFLERIPFISKVDDVVFAARNAVLISNAASIALSHGCDAVAIGCNASDWERFPDCRPAFINAMAAVLEAYGVHLLAPVLRMSKAEVVAKAKELNVGPTWSCYSPIDNHPCGECLACKTRAAAGA